MPDGRFIPTCSATSLDNRLNASALTWSFKANGHITHLSLQLLTSGAIGVVLGDIGTSPRYAFRAELNPEAAGDINAPDCESAPKLAPPTKVGII